MDITFQHLAVNGVELRVAIQEPTSGGSRPPLVVLIHGWPESWYAWRHQIPVIADAGFRVAAPDLRGYGGSDCPETVEEYSMVKMTDDVAQLVEALGHDHAILVGHDWGAPIAWVSAIRFPLMIRAVAGLSVPHLRRAHTDIRSLYEQLYRDRFFYMLHFQQEGLAEAELEADVESSLRKIYYAASGDCEASDRGFSATASKSGLLEGLVDPDPFPEWLSGQDLDYLVSQYSRSGFRGGLNRYRNFERDWRELPELSESIIEQPALFIAGNRDPVLDYIPGKRLHEEMDEMYANLRGKYIFEGIGHWVQQEAPAATNEVLLQFLREL